MELSGRRAVVTGASRGIGRAVVQALVTRGAEVFAVSRNAEDLGRLSRELGVSWASADVSRPDEVQAAFAKAREGGAVDILVSAAGIAASAPLVKTDDATWNAILSTNLSGAFYCLREALPEMVRRGWGRVVVLASIAGKTGSPYISAYAASKHGVLGLTKCAALETAAAGVTVNAVCPGYVDTPMTDQSIARIVDKTGADAVSVRQRLEALSPQKRLFTSEEVASLILYLCGHEARGITGQALSLDGGTVV